MARRQRSFLQAPLHQAIDVIRGECLYREQFGFAYRRGEEGRVLCPQDNHSGGSLEVAILGVPLAVALSITLTITTCGMACLGQRQ